MIKANRTDQLSKTAGDVREIVAALAIAKTLDQDSTLCLKLRRHAACADDQPLNLELPAGSGGLQIRPDGSIRPVRAAENQVATNLDALISQHLELQRIIELARPRITEQVRAAVLPFFVLGTLPSREEFVQLERWAALIEMPAYRFCARALEELDSWRASAIAEAKTGVSDRETVLGRYNALIHTVGHLTLLCSGTEATPWLSSMAESFTWTNWTPTFPLVRERTVWLAAAAARSAVAFGAGVIDRYADVLTRATHVMQLVDALFGLAAIGLSDGNVRENIAALISAESKVVARRLITGAAFTEAAFRSATNCLARSDKDLTGDHDLLKRLSWQPASLRGLGTPEAFRLDPTEIDETGQIIGFRALPHILQAKAPFHYPLRPRARGPLLPTLHEMPPLLLRAWGASSQIQRTIH